MFASTILNYMDRQTISLVNPQITRAFSLSQEGFGWVLASFQLSYALFQVPAGYLADRFSTRTLYAAAVAFWSLAGMATAFAPTLGVLLCCRALLGMGEAFNWPCALRATSRVLSPAERGLGNGIFNSGAAVGAIVTPLLVPPLTAVFGWRPAFVIVGALGFGWVGLWLYCTRGIAELARRSPERREKNGASADRRACWLAVAASAGIAAAWLTQVGRWSGNAVWLAVATLMISLLLAARILPLRMLEPMAWFHAMGEIVRSHRFWVLVLVSCGVNTCWHFLVNWLPTFLQKDRGMAFVVGGMLTALPFLAADAGNLAGGAITRMLAPRGRNPGGVRIAVITGCAALIIPGALIGAVRFDAVVIVLLCLMAFGTAAYMANYFALTQEVDHRHTGLVVGILGGLGNLCAAGFAPLAGWIKDSTGTFGPVFGIVGVLPLCGVAALWLGWGRGKGLSKES
jgi:ACS family hexuronate transporter-like MFS transporter